MQMLNRAIMNFLRAVKNEVRPTTRKIMKMIIMPSGTQMSPPIIQFSHRRSRAAISRSLCGSGVL